MKILLLYNSNSKNTGTIFPSRMNKRALKIQEMLSTDFARRLYVSIYLFSEYP